MSKKYVTWGQLAGLAILALFVFGIFRAGYYMTNPGDCAKAYANEPNKTVESCYARRMSFGSIFSNKPLGCKCFFTENGRFTSEEWG